MGRTWSRLESSTRAERREGGTLFPDLQPGLAAAIADPLWMLGRQWQIGEWRGEDAPSPVRVELEIQHTRPTELQAGTATYPIPEALSVLEPLVESDNPDQGPSAFRLAADAGRQFLRLLESFGASSARTLFRQKYPLIPPVPSHLDSPNVSRTLTLLARTGLDGTKLATALRASPATALPAIPTALKARVDKATAAFLRWMDERIQLPPERLPIWQPERLEHRFALSAKTTETTLTLNASEYPGGHLDWHRFDLVQQAGNPDAPRKLESRTIKALPTPARFRGMPVRRWWEFEDGTIHFGGLEAGPADPARLLVAEFATIAGDDWYLVPVSVPFGSLCRVNRLTIIDAFGGRTQVRSSALVDGPQRTWRFFELTGDNSVAGGKAPWVYVAPAAGLVIEGDPVEKISLARDEQANLGWAIEHRVESALGKAVDRDPPARGFGTAETAGSTWQYRAEMDAPPHHIPLVPVTLKGSPQYQFRRATLAGWSALPPEAAAGAQGRLLQPGTKFTVYEEELPAEGIQVIRNWQLTRRSDGRPVLWLGRRKVPGKGPMRSNLRWDSLLKTQS